MRAHEQAALLRALQSTTDRVSQAQDTLENELKLHQKTTWITDQMTLQKLRFLLQEERMLKCFARVASILRDKLRKIT
jgi:hypothetical protein